MVCVCWELLTLQNTLFCLSTAASQQTRNIDPVLGHCWVTVCDAGPTSPQHWVNVSCLLGHSWHWSVVTCAAHNEPWLIAPGGGVHGQIPVSVRALQSSVPSQGHPTHYLHYGLPRYAFRYDKTQVWMVVLRIRLKQGYWLQQAQTAQSNYQWLIDCHIIK